MLALVHTAYFQWIYVGSELCVSPQYHFVHNFLQRFNRHTKVFNIQYKIEK